MDVITQAPQPTIKCYHSIKNGVAVKEPYHDFTPMSSYLAGQNLQSYNFENTLDNFGGSFSFTIKEETTGNISAINKTFMDEVRPLDVVVFSEKGSETSVDFIGVVTTVSVGGIASNLNKTVTVSGKSIEWLFLYYNINTDLKSCIFENNSANKAFKVDLAKRDGKVGISIKDIVLASFNMFKERANLHPEISNTVICDLINIWYDKDPFECSTDNFMYPISSNLFETGKITFIDFIKKILPSPIYEIFGYINNLGKPKLCVRSVPFDKPTARYSIDAGNLTDFTLTKTCEEVYTAFMPYVEGSSKDPAFYMNLQAAQGGIEKGYNIGKYNPEKVKLYGFQLLTCSFIGYKENTETNAETIDNSKIVSMAQNMEEWFSNLDDMYNGDLTIVNIIEEKHATIGEWVGFAEGLFYVHAAKHSWNYGDNPMINYSLSRGGKYVGGKFHKLNNLSAAYREFD